MNTPVELEEFSDITPVIRALPNVKISGIITSPMKKFQTAYEARGTSGSHCTCMHVVTTKTVCCSAGFLRTYVVWLGGRGSELQPVHENWYMNIDHVVYMFMYFYMSIVFCPTVIM